MTNIENGLKYMARSIRNEVNIKFTEKQRTLVSEMFKQITKSEMLQSDFNSIEYCWYGIESNVKRQALEENINEDYGIISDCLDSVYGFYEICEISIRDKHDVALNFSEEVVNELEITSSMTYKMGINVHLSEAIQKYRCLVAILLVHIYDGFHLDCEVEFYQYLVSLVESRLN